MAGVKISNATDAVTLNATDKLPIARDALTTPFYVQASYIVTFMSGQAITWTKAQGTSITTLTDGASITPDLSESNAFQVQLGGNRTLEVPTGLVAGKSQDFRLNVYQDGTGGRTLTYAWCYKPVITGLSAGKYQFDSLFGTVNRYATNTVTMTIATPCVVTWTGVPIFSGEIIQFTTTGALPTGVSANTSYYINKTGTDTFNLATSLANLQAGTFVASSGSQSGTHTGTSISITISPILGLG